MLAKYACSRIGDRTETNNKHPAGSEKTQERLLNGETTCPDRWGSPRASPQPCCTAPVSWAHRRCQLPMPDLSS